MTTFPFDRIEIADDNLTAEEAMEHYERYGFLWLRLKPQEKFQISNNGKSKSNAIFSTLQQIYWGSPEAFQRKWSVENAGRYADESQLSADAVLGKGTSGNDTSCSSSLNHFYCSTILSRKKDPTTLKTALDKCLGSYFVKGNGSSVTAGPPQLGESKHHGGVWLFLGKHENKDNGVISAAAVDGDEPARKKKKSEAQQALVGRAEHVDSVTHSGTWHLQLSGRKTWILRPNVEADDWDKSHDQGNNNQDKSKDEDDKDYGPPDLNQYLGLKSTSTTSSNNVKVEKSETGAVRLRCHVEEGDLFVVNTRAWYHRTEIPVSPDWSISMARDFFLPVPPVKCPRDVAAGDIVLEEDEIPDHFPVSSEDAEANCVMAEAGTDAEHHGDDNPEEDEDEDNMIVLVALKDLKEGDSLILKVAAASGEESGSDSSDEEEEENAPESVDPRAISKQDWKKGSVVLTGGEIPEDLPRSMNPNCEMEEDGNSNVIVRSLKAIGEGDIITIAPDDEEGMDDYEEVEVNLETGAIERGGVSATDQ